MAITTKRTIIERDGTLPIIRAFYKKYDRTNKKRSRPYRSGRQGMALAMP